MASKFGFGFKPTEETKQRTKTKSSTGSSSGQRKRRRTNSWSNTGGSSGYNDSWQEYARRAREEAWRRSQSGFASSTNGLRLSDTEKLTASEIVDAGLRALSRKYHPDMGGSHDQMVAVNNMVEKLRKLIKG